MRRTTHDKHRWAAAGLALLLAGCAGRPTVAPAAPGAPPAAEASEAAGTPASRPRPEGGVNLLLFRHGPTETGHTSRLLPFYSYEVDDERQERSFTLWPLLTGYETGPNHDRFFSLPLMTLAGGSQTQSTRRSELISIPLLTSISSQESPSEESWKMRSLPLLSIREMHVFKGTRGSVRHETWRHPLGHSEWISRRGSGKHADSQLRIARHSIGVPLQEGEGLTLLELSQWDDERHVRLANVFDISMLGFARFRGRYPGAPYLEQSTPTPAQAEQTPRSPVEADTPMVTQFDLLGPLVRFRTNARDQTRWQCLPLFAYARDGERTAFQLVPLMLEWSDGGPRFNPATWTKLWPLLYHDEFRRRWDVLWPLAFYVDDEIEDRTELRVRLLFRYYRKGDYVRVRVLQGLLYDHTTHDRGSETRVLMGFLYSAQHDRQSQVHQWDLLRGLLFGVATRPGEDPTYQLLFVRFGGAKHAPPTEDDDSGDGK